MKQKCTKQIHSLENQHRRTIITSVYSLDFHTESRQVRRGGPNTCLPSPLSSSRLCLHDALPVMGEQDWSIYRRELSHSDTNKNHIWWNTHLYTYIELSRTKM